MASRELVYEAINGERDYQEGWKNPELTNCGGVRSNTEFLVYIRDYVEEALRLAVRRSDTECLFNTSHSLRKIAALAVAAMEQNGVLFRDKNDNLLQRHKGE